MLRPRLRFRRISVKLLAFNILLLSLPMVSLLYLDTYERQLLRAQENSMIQQGRLLSAALNGSAALEEDAALILKNLKNRGVSRIRIVDSHGRLLADSAQPVELPVPAESKYWRTDASTSAEETLLYRAAVYPLNAVKKLLFPPAPDLGSGEYYSGKSVFDGPEITAALDGRYGASTRLSSGGQRSINLYSAIPVFAESEELTVTGAVLVSRSTYQILSYLYEFRLDIIRIFVIFLAVSVVISFSLAMSITVPVVRLKNEAGKILDESGNFRSHFTGFRRQDEIGELSRSLTMLSTELENKMDFINRFTADMLHELKNPLSAIKGAAQMALAAEGTEGSFDLRSMMNHILNEEKRMERLLSELRKLSSLENRIENEQTEDVDVSAVLPVILERYPGIVFQDNSMDDLKVRINVDRFVQAVTNPVDNAVSFNSDSNAVSVCLDERAGFCVVTVEDNGPGLSEKSRARVFERFYSERSETDRNEHSGLGLSIVKSITSYYGGRCSIENRPSGGCRFILEFPVCAV